MPAVSPCPRLTGAPATQPGMVGSARASCRTRVVWGVLMLELLLHPPGGVTEGRCWAHTCQVGLFPLSFGAVSTGGKELSLCHVCDHQHQPLPGSWVSNLSGCRAAKHRAGWWAPCCQK